VTAVLVASGQRIVMELGGYHGACSRALALALDRLGCAYRRLLVVEYDKELADIVAKNLQESGTETQCTVMNMDSLEAIKKCDDRSLGFVWVDDSHDTPHVLEELIALVPKMVDGGIILFHDVCGNYRLHHVVSLFGGYSLSLPRVSTSGGIGFLQVRPSTRLIPIPSYSWPADAPCKVLKEDLEPA